MKFNVILAVLSLGIALLLAEFILQSVDVEKLIEPKPPISNWAQVPERVWTEYHPELGWYHQPGKQTSHVTQGDEFSVKINSAGMRSDRNYLVDKPVGRKRIAVIGDSFTFGFGVENESTFVSVLEKNLPGYEVLNFGIPGYGIDQMYVLYQTIVTRYSPDMVMLGIFPEDFWRATRAFADSGHAKPYFFLRGNGELELKNVPVPKQFALKSNQFPQMYEYSDTEKTMRKSALYRFLKKSWIRLGKNTGFMDPDLTDEWRVGQVILKDFVDSIKAEGSVPVIVLLPPDRWVKTDDDTSLHKSINRFAKRNKYTTLDLTPIFREAIAASDITEYYIQNDWHWTEKGHAIAAEQLHEFIQKSAL